MMRSLFVAALLLAPVVFAASTEEEAGDVSEVDKDALGPLRERVPPVSGFLFLKKQRLEFSPGLTISAKDAFYTKYVPGVSLAYYFTEHVALGVRVGYAFNLISGAAEICIPPGGTQKAGCSPPKDEDLTTRVPGKLGLVGGVDLQWAPIYN